MKKYTIEDMKAFPVINGVRQCPTGDYSGIQSFGADCSFGERCRFGKECECEFGIFDGMRTYGGAGRYGRTTYFFHIPDKNAIYVRCGCFHGTLEEWEQQVVETHGDSRYAKEYLAAVPLIQIAFGCEEEEEQKGGDEG